MPDSNQMFGKSSGDTPDFLKSIQGRRKKSTYRYKLNKSFSILLTYILKKIIERDIFKRKCFRKAQTFLKFIFLKGGYCNYEHLKDNIK